MAPPQVKLNEKPTPAEVCLQDPLPEKKDAGEQPPVIVTMDRNRTRTPRCYLTAQQRQQRKRCRIGCCVSLTFILLLLMGLGSALLVYRMKHRRGWALECNTEEGHRIPEHVNVDHNKQLIYVRPDQHTPMAMDIIHEYNRKMVAFRNATDNKCYIDRLDETFSEGYARWQQFEDGSHEQNRMLHVLPQPIQIEVVTHFAGVHIVEHCGGVKVEYYWAMEVVETEIQPGEKYVMV